MNTTELRKQHVKYLYEGKGCWVTRRQRAASGRGGAGHTSYLVAFEDGSSEFIPAGKFNATALCKDCKRKMSNCKC